MPANDNKNQKIICVVGPTASGKSSLAVNISKAYDGEVISCDSMQLYKGMDIGTAKITPDEAKGVPHHLTSILDVNDSFSVSDYVLLADKCVSDISARGKLPVICGGTGLYVDSYISGISFSEYENLPEYRKELEEYASVNGSHALHAKLAECDAQSAYKIDPENVKRVIRALEVFKSTGIPISEWNKKALEEANPKDAMYIGITFEDRNLLYDRINMRVDLMIKHGLVEETKELIEQGIKSSQTAGQAIGYKELYAYFDGTSSLEECVEKLKINSRHYAKRQLTWFNRNKDVKWIVADGLDSEKIFEKAKEFCKAYLLG